MGWRRLIHAGLIGCAALALCACGFTDSYAPVPAFMRTKRPDPPPPEPPPDVKQIVHDNLTSIFVSTSAPRDVLVSPPRLQPGGSGWTDCVRADVNSATGRPIGTETFQITIVGGEIVDRKRVGDDDHCGSESYRPI